jgi:hypothetical protein
MPGAPGSVWEPGSCGSTLLRLDSLQPPYLSKVLFVGAATALPRSKALAHTTTRAISYG